MPPPLSLCSISVQQSGSSSCIICPEGWLLINNNFLSLSLFLSIYVCVFLQYLYYNLNFPISSFIFLSSSPFLISSYSCVLRPQLGSYCPNATCEPISCPPQRYCPQGSTAPLSCATLYVPDKLVRLDWVFIEIVPLVQW